MATKHNQINLLPARWKNPGQLTDVQKKLQLISLLVLGGYIAVSLGILGWLGFLKIRQNQIASATQNVISQLDKFHHVEAAQAILESKAAFGLQAFEGGVNSGVAFTKGTRLFSNLLQFNQITTDSKGKISISGTASSSAGASSANVLLENPQGAGRQLFNQAVASLQTDQQGHITLSFDLQFIPAVPTVDLTH